MYIAYDIKNGVEYAKLVKSIRKGTKVVKEYSNLGRVLDKKLGIYKSRERGIYRYDAANDFYDNNPDGLPIYFRYCPGNVIDVSTLITTIKELKKNGVNTKFSILDAGDYSEENIRRLYYNNISFITRLPVKLKLYKEEC